MCIFSQDTRLVKDNWQGFSKTQDAVIGWRSGLDVVLLLRPSPAALEKVLNVALGYAVLAPELRYRTD